VDHVAGGQAVAARDAGLPRRAAAEGAALGQQLGAGGVVDRAVDAAAAEQAFVGGVDDGVDGEPGDVGLQRPIPLAIWTKPSAPLKMRAPASFRR
jgi:hypothetical protein